MDMVTFTCPNCGENAERKQNDYFAKCPYCGAEIGFNDLKEEAAEDVYKQKVETLEQRSALEQKINSQAAKWVKFRNISLVVMGVLHTAGFAAFAIADYLDNETGRGIGVVPLLIAWFIGFFMLPGSCIFYPKYDLRTDRENNMIQVKQAVKVFAVALMVAVTTSYAAYLIYKAVIPKL